MDLPNLKSKFALSLGVWSHKPRTFHRFKELPFEIRECIWMYTLPPPRIIEVIATGTPNCISTECLGRSVFHSKAPFSALPRAELFDADFKEFNSAVALLRICSQSRAVALKHFDRTLSTTISPRRIYATESWRNPSDAVGFYKHPVRTTGETPGIWFRRNSDILFIRDEDTGAIACALNNASALNLQTGNITSLAIGAKIWNNALCNRFSTLDKGPALFCGLKELIIIRETGEDALDLFFSQDTMNVEEIRRRLEEHFTAKTPGSVPPTVVCMDFKDFIASQRWTVGSMRNYPRGFDELAWICHERDRAGPSGNFGSNQ